MTSISRSGSPKETTPRRGFEPAHSALTSQVPLSSPEKPDPSRARRFLFLASIGFTVILLVCFEAGFRIYLFHFASPGRLNKYARSWDIPADARKFKPHPYLNHALNERYRSEDGLNRHNALGFRGAEFPREKLPGTYRIACLGGSSTYETKIADYRSAYPDQLQEVLRSAYGRTNVHVINAGVAGYTSWELLINLQLRVLDLSPDLIVIYEATNDVQARLVPPAQYLRDGTGHRKPWEPSGYGWWDHSLVLRFAGLKLGFSAPSSLDSTINVEHGDPERPGDWLSRNPPVYLADNLRDMVAVTRAHGASIMFSSWTHRGRGAGKAPDPAYLRGLEENNETIRRVAEEEGVPFYDHASEMPQDDAYWADERHVNEKGALRKAELFAAFIEAKFLVAR